MHESASRYPSRYHFKRWYLLGNIKKPIEYEGDGILCDGYGRLGHLLKKCPNQRQIGAKDTIETSSAGHRTNEDDD